MLKRGGLKIRKLKNLILMHEIFNMMVCVNGKHPSHTKKIRRIRALWA